MEICTCSENGRDVIVAQNEKGEYIYVCNNCGNIIKNGKDKIHKTKRNNQH